MRDQSVENTTVKCWRKDLTELNVQTGHHADISTGVVVRTEKGSSFAYSQLQHGEQELGSLNVSNPRSFFEVLYRYFLIFSLSFGLLPEAFSISRIPLI